MGIIASGVVGVLSRNKDLQLPDFIASYAGDFMWAGALYLFSRILFNPPSRSRQSTRRVVLMPFNTWSVLKTATAALAISFFVEISQLDHVVWLGSIRSTIHGGLILGKGFRWSDCACYFTGILVYASIEVLISRKEHSKNNS